MEVVTPVQFLIKFINTNQQGVFEFFIVVSIFLANLKQLVYLLFLTV